MGGCVTGNTIKKQNILQTDPKPKQSAPINSQPLQPSTTNCVDPNPQIQPPFIQLPTPHVCSPDLPNSHDFTFLKVPIESPPSEKFPCQKCKFLNFSSIMKCRQCSFQSCQACTPLPHHAVCPYPNWQYKVAQNQSLKCCFCKICCSQGYMECRNCKGIACSACVDVKEDYHCGCQFKSGVYTPNKCFYCCVYFWQSLVCNKCKFNTCQNCYQTKYLKKSTPNQSTLS